MMNFEELNQTTRNWMLEEFQNEEQSGNPYRSKDMTAHGLTQFARIMKNVIQNEDEVILAEQLSDPSFWNPTYSYIRKDKLITAKLNPAVAAKRLALSEFNTWYVRGLARKLIEEKVEQCEVYRAEAAWEPRSECQDHDGKIFQVSDVYNGHRARYWPSVNPMAFSVPVGPNCHHTIRRLKK